MATRSKLAVILHADVVGSTALVQADERLAHERIRKAFEQLSGTIAQYGGTAHEVRGDALVAEFNRASDAVTASLAFQVENRSRNESLSGEIRPEVRIGVALGEVVIADKTVTGAGVILAQRIEQLANAGSICISAAVHEALPKRLPVDFRNLGEKPLKGFADPVRVFSVALQPGEQPPPPPADALGAHEGADTSAPFGISGDKASIAVLPFRNLSSDPDQAFFSDGITEDIITTLSRISGIAVVARQSTEVYKGKSVNAAKVSREQGVRYVLEGSVRAAPNRVRITAQLIDAGSGHHVWGERYDRVLDDVFAVQDEITRRVTAELQVQLTEGEQARAWSGGTENLEAWKLVVRASQLLSTHLREDALEARKLAKQAAELDPGFASAWTVIGWTHWQEARSGWGRTPELSIEQMSEAAETALRLESENPDALALLGACYFLTGDFDRAVETYDRAVDLAPNHSWIVAMAASIRLYCGMPRESIPLIEKAMRLSPIFPTWFLVILGHVRLMTEDFEKATEAYEQALGREPESIPIWVGLIASLSQAGRSDEAVSAAQELLKLAPRFSLMEWLKARPFKDPDQREQYRQALLAAGLPD